MANRKVPSQAASGSDTFSDNLVGRQITDGTSLLTNTNFELDRVIPTKDSKKFRTGKFSDFITLDDLQEEQKPVTRKNSYETDEKIKFNSSKNNANRSLFGSLKSRILVSLSNIINNYPAAFIVDKTSYTKTTLNMASDILYDADLNITEFYIEYGAIYNPLDIIFKSNDVLDTTTDIKKFYSAYKSYVIDISGITYDIVDYRKPDSDSRIKLKVTGDPFNGATGYTESIIVKPNNGIIEEFYNSLDDLETILLNRETTPIFTSTFYVPKDSTDNKKTVLSPVKITWPVDDYGWNIKIIGLEYLKFVEDLSGVAEEVDNYKSNLFVRFMASPQLFEFDTEDKKGEAIFQLYGQSFDKVKKYIENIAYMRNVSYDGINNVPDYLLKNLATTLGMSTVNLYDEKTLNKLLYTRNDSVYDGIPTGANIIDAEIEFYRRLLVNLAYIFKTKGTRECIEFFLKFLGAPEPLIKINEYVYEITSFPKSFDLESDIYDAIARLKTYDVAVYNTGSSIYDIVTTTGTTTLTRDEYPVIEDGILPRELFSETNDYFFQMGAGWYDSTLQHRSSDILDTENSILTGRTKTILTKSKPFTYGEDYFDLFRTLPGLDTGFELKSVVSDKLSDVNTNNDLILNRKNISVYLSSAQAIDYDIYRKSRELLLSFGSNTLDPQTGVTFAEYLNKMINEQITNSHTIRYSKNYIQLEDIYQSYIQSSGFTPYTYASVSSFINNLGPYWTDLISQIMPASTLWTGGNLIENSIFGRPKYGYKKPCQPTTITENLYLDFQTTLSEDLELVIGDENKLRGLNSVSGFTYTPIFDIDGTIYSGTPIDISGFASTDNSAGLFDIFPITGCSDPLTINVFPKPLDIYAFITTTYNLFIIRDYLTAPSPVNGIPLKGTILGDDPNISTHIKPLANAEVGQTWTLSVYTKVEDPAMPIQLGIFGRDSSGVIVEGYQDWYYGLTTNWSRIEMTKTFMHPDVVEITIRLDLSDIDSHVGLSSWFDGCQLELNSYATPLIDYAPQLPLICDFKTYLNSDIEKIKELWKQAVIDTIDNVVNNGSKKLTYDFSYDSEGNDLLVLTSVKTGPTECSVSDYVDFKSISENTLATEASCTFDVSFQTNGNIYPSGSESCLLNGDLYITVSNNIGNQNNSWPVYVHKNCEPGYNPITGYTSSGSTMEAPNGDSCTYVLYDVRENDVIDLLFTDAANCDVKARIEGLGMQYFNPTSGNTYEYQLYPKVQYRQSFDYGFKADSKVLLVSGATINSGTTSADIENYKIAGTLVETNISDLNVSDVILCADYLPLSGFSINYYQQAKMNNDYSFIVEYEAKTISKIDCLGSLKKYSITGTTITSATTIFEVLQTSKLKVYTKKEILGNGDVNIRDSFFFDTRYPSDLQVKGSENGDYLIDSEGELIEVTAINLEYCVPDLYYNINFSGTNGVDLILFNGNNDYQLLTQHPYIDYSEIDINLQQYSLGNYCTEIPPISALTRSYSVDCYDCDMEGIAEYIDFTLPIVSGDTFITQWDITSGDTTLTLPLRNGYNYNMIVDWGDGSETSLITSYNDINKTHTYAGYGTYNISIYGTCESWYVNGDVTIKDKIISVAQWGDVKFSYDGLINAFAGCSNLSSLPSGPMTGVENVTLLNNTFVSCTSLSTIPSGLFDNCTGATSINNVFKNCTSLTSIPSGLFDNNLLTTTFEGAFNSCTGITSVPEGLFSGNTEASEFFATFSGCTNLQLNEFIFYSGSSSGTTRFVDKFMDFRHCFERSAFSGTQGTAPKLWEVDYGIYSPLTTDCFAGAGNSITSLSNYNNIPSAWGGPA